MASVADRGTEIARDVSNDFDWLAASMNRHPKMFAPGSPARRAMSHSHHPIFGAVGQWITSKEAAVCAGGGSCLDHPPPPVDCHNPKYGGALTGRARSRGDDRFIVDFVPVGNDLDVVEIRMLETWAAVDVFVLYEAVYTHRGDAKPCFLNISMARTDRWTQFRPKILHLMDTEAGLRAARRSTLRDIRAGKQGWDLEHSMRERPVQLLKSSYDSLAMKVRGHFFDRDAVALQNDGDEIASGAALMHLKRCEASREPPYLLPATGLKGGLRFVLNTEDTPEHSAMWLTAAWGRHKMGAPAQLPRFVWKEGPTVNVLKRVLDSDAGQGRHKASATWPDFGPGAAMHLSSNADPVQQWCVSGSCLPPACDFWPLMMGMLVPPPTCKRHAHARGAALCDAARAVPLDASLTRGNETPCRRFQAQSPRDAGRAAQRPAEAADRCRGQHGHCRGDQRQLKRRARTVLRQPVCTRHDARRRLRGDDQELGAVATSRDAQQVPVHDSRRVGQHRRLPHRVLLAPMLLKPCFVARA